ncbi:sensor histidine kinase [Paenibacillus sp. OAS669]|uniref:sensor histidine kinase n=1 Tax=Paenibacillus sp. OAS669 TaxID=2663821 RepID=UPI001788F02D|nr:sensor histidine kinase [Paenibacillus sp. OAS669]MBE1447055.1 signal transduction histidine kinase [Paenibacillus sp. OAS669]
MRGIDFISDRLGYIIIYLVNIALALCVVELALQPQGVSLQTDNIVYIIILSLAGVCTYLLIDYVRQREYFLRLSGIRKHHEPMERISGLPVGVKKEQMIMMELMHELYSGCEERLAQYRKQQEQHDVFIRQWVHQMKTPVSVIDLLTQKTESSEEHVPLTVLQSIQEENDRLAHGLDMMLQTARLEKFELDVHVKQVNLEQTIRSVINEHKRACIRRGVYPKLTVEADVRFVETDEKWIAVIIRQIVTNAIKYAKRTADPADKQLEIKLSKGKDGVCASFSDTGIGIPEQDLPRVFEPFFTGENGRKVGESTGMGLYLVKELCRKLGHRVQIASIEGEGTTVTLHFPPSSVLHDILTR